VTNIPLLSGYLLKYYFVLKNKNFKSISIIDIIHEHEAKILKLA